VNYTAEGTEVEIALQKLSSNGDTTALITVRDRGRGVPEESLPDIFLPFYRVGDARDRSTGGSGLGLSITDRAIRLHGGTVRALNCRDGGLLIELRLPCAGRTKSEAKSEGAKVPAMGPARG
jgi:two-component system sensor histidine kinase CpxA